MKTKNQRTFLSSTRATEEQFNDAFNIRLTAALRFHKDPPNTSRLITRSSIMVDASLSNIDDCVYSIDRMMMKASPLVLQAGNKADYRNYLRSTFNFKVDGDASIRDECFNTIIDIYGEAIALHRRTVINIRDALVEGRLNFTMSYLMSREIDCFVVSEPLTQIFHELQSDVQTQHFDNTRTMRRYNRLCKQAINKFKSTSDNFAIVPELFEKGSE